MNTKLYRSNNSRRKIIEIYKHVIFTTYIIHVSVILITGICFQSLSSYYDVSMNSRMREGLLRPLPYSVYNL